jgi:hypothetical protein
MNMLREWIWILAFFPLWAACAIAALALISGAERMTKVRMPESIYAGAALGGLLLAVAILLWVDCLFFISLPFATPVCRTFGF